jgi:hypothetical protein
MNERVALYRRLSGRTWWDPVRRDSDLSMKLRERVRVAFLQDVDVLRFSYALGHLHHSETEMAVELGMPIGQQWNCGLSTSLRAEKMAFAEGRHQTIRALPAGRARPPVPR